MKTNKKIYKDNQYTLSIDPGLNNVGWALFDEENKKGLTSNLVTLL